MKPRVLLLFLLSLSGCANLVSVKDRPIPDLVYAFTPESPTYNNRVPLLHAVDQAKRVLVVGVSDKKRAALSGDRIFSVADSIPQSTNVFTAFRYSHMPNDLEYVEVYKIPDEMPVGELLYSIKSKSVGEINHKVYEESQFRRFTGEVDQREFVLSGFVTLPEQLAGLVNEFGWRLGDGGAFMDVTNQFVVLAKDVQMSVVSVDKRVATEEELSSVVNYWQSLYPELAGLYVFEFDKRKKTVFYSRGGS